MRVFVAGATGVVGRPLVSALVGAGHQVTGTTRSPAKAAVLHNLGATPVIVDGLDPEPLPTTEQGLAAIRHVEDTVPAAVPEGLVLRYGPFYGHGASDFMLDLVTMMTQARGAANDKARHELGWSPRYPSWRDGFPAWVKGLRNG